VADSGADEVRHCVTNLVGHTKTVGPPRRALMTRAAELYFARNIAAAMLAGDWEKAGMRDRLYRAWGRRSKWLIGLANRARAVFPVPPSHDELTAFVLASDRFRFHVQRLGPEHRSLRHGREMEVFWARPAMGDTAVPTTAPLPGLPTTGALADWLGLTPGQLTVYADVLRLNRFHLGHLPPRRPYYYQGIRHRDQRTPYQPFHGERDERRHPYRYRWVPKRGRRVRTADPPPPPAGFFRRIVGWLAASVRDALPVGPGHRLLEIPKPRLKQAQRKVLDHILAVVPPHPSAHAFRRGRSVLTNATPHCGRRVVLRFDLADFFASVPAGRVKGVFLALGFPPTVARLLAGLCTTVTPFELWERFPGGARAMTRADQDTAERLQKPHLPQGAPTSPALANLCSYRLDRRLAGLAAKLGATYTRYADDLTFSGSEDLRRAHVRVRRAVTRIAADEGFVVNVRKSRVLPCGRRQVVAGVVVNDKPNVPRAEFDTLKAILTNCARSGTASQNRENHPDFRAHLLGRISHVAMLNPYRGAKLRAIFDRIAWGG
jgi:hypothetical protein